MLNLIQLHDLFDHLGTPEAGRRLIEKCRREAPVRKVQSNRSNVITHYSSRKMQRMIACESRTVEFPAAVQYEHDARVLEYYAQPTQLDMWDPGGEGRKACRWQHTPDFLLLREDQLIFEEWREEDRLVRLSHERPWRCFKDAGGWRAPIVEEQLAEMGITYQLRSADEHPRQFVQNLGFLETYMGRACSEVGPEARRNLMEMFANEGAIPLTHLLERSNAALGDEQGSSPSLLFTLDDVYKGIADGWLTFDLCNEDLSSTHRVWVFRDEAALMLARKVELAAQAEEELADLACGAASIDIGTEVALEGRSYRVSLLKGDQILLSGEEERREMTLDRLLDLHAKGEAVVKPQAAKGLAAVDVVRALPPVEVARTLQRAEWLEIAERHPDQVPRSARTLRRYRKAMREAGESLADQHLALASKYANCGDRSRKIPQDTLDAIEQVVTGFFNTTRDPYKKATYKVFRAICEEKSVRPCSSKTFYRELERRRSVKLQKGKRWAYQTDPITWYLRMEDPVHGVRPFQFVHIDHTQLDMFCASTTDRKTLGKPWLSLAIDAESRAVLGFYLTFEAPSYRSCMMVVRDLVRRNGRMPEMLVLDNGKEFHSKAMQRLCQLYRCSIRYRPPSKSRFGSVIERLFGTVNTQFIHNLEGNSKILKTPRRVTKSVSPEKHPVWNLPLFHGALEEYFFRFYGVALHPAHGEAPLAHLRKRMEETGERRNRLVAFDATFLIETCPSPVDSDTRKVDPQRGIKVHHLWYRNDLFQSFDLRGKSIEVREDPWDIEHVYVLHGNRWHACRTNLPGYLRGCTATELRYAFAELSERLGIQRKDLTAGQAAEFKALMDFQGFTKKIQEQQAQAKEIYAPLGMTSALGSSEGIPAASREVSAEDMGDSFQAPLPRKVPKRVQAAGPTLPVSDEDGMIESPINPSQESEESDDEYALF